MNRPALCVSAALFVLATALGAFAQARANRANYTISGPFTHQNLTIFLIHGPDGIPHGSLLTLQEALEQKKIIVHETGDVNQLAVENVGEQDVFIQSGDIVKGGRQDRTFSLDFICPPKSGKMPIESFCVEAGRWQQRGGEAPTVFADSAYALSSKGLKMAAKKEANQSQVWQEVSQAQTRLSSNLGANVASPRSSSSLQLTLENEKLRQRADDYVKEMSEVAEEKSDAIGFAFAINGQINSADVYASHDLFLRLWPKMLRAASTEALAELNGKAAAEAVAAQAIGTFLSQGDSAKETQQKKVTDRVTMITRETPAVILFETRDRGRNDAWIHRNYVAPDTGTGQATDQVQELQRAPAAE